MRNAHAEYFRAWATKTLEIVYVRQQWVDDAFTIIIWAGTREHIANI